MIYIGVDLGSAQDYTAILGFRVLKDRMSLVFADRPPLGTPYPNIINAIDMIYQRAKAHDRDVHLIVDKTGVGRPIVDELKARDLSITPVVITGGKTAHCDPKTGDWTVPKIELISAVSLAMASGQLKFARSLALVPALLNELKVFRAKSGGRQMEAARESDHDDLVLATAIAVWWYRRQGPENPEESEQPYDAELEERRRYWEQERNAKWYWKP